VQQQVIHGFDVFGEDSHHSLRGFDERGTRVCGGSFLSPHADRKRASPYIC
jgi:hypothetical protein